MKKRVIVVMPAYTAEATLERTWRDIPADLADEVILVDDGSRDRTVEIARRLGMVVIERGSNRGYGANQKTCFGRRCVAGRTWSPCCIRTTSTMRELCPSSPA